MRDLLKRLFKTPHDASQPTRERLSFDAWPSAVYAVGDVHGCATELSALEARIVADGTNFPGEKWIVMLGDYVDRGPRSADVLDRLCARPPAGFRRVCLAGNHEVMMLQFLADPRSDSPWLTFGGLETLQSYGIDVDQFMRLAGRAKRALLESHIPGEHIELMTHMPAYLALGEMTFVHAGLRPGIALEDQSEDDLLWIREPFLSSSTTEFGLVVHGHTPSPQPDIHANRICLDTGAFATGILTAARFSQATPPAYLSTGNPTGSFGQ